MSALLDAIVGAMILHGWDPKAARNAAVDVVYQIEAHGFRVIPIPGVTDTPKTGDRS